MKNLKIGFALIAAIVAMSFTFASRSGVIKGKFANYTPTATCFRTINFSIVQGINSVSIPVLGQGAISYITVPSAFGCGKNANTVQLNSTSPVVKLSDLSNVTASNAETLCDETVNAVCCFHVNTTTKTVTDVCTGIPQ